MNQTIRGNSLTASQALQLALGHYTAGRLDEAEAICRSVLQVLPEQANALHLLGLVARQRGDNETAVTLWRQAIASAPSVAEVHYNLGNALKERGEFAAAITSYRQAVALRPNYPKAFHNLGIALQSEGRLDEAIASYRQAVDLQPDYAEVHLSLGEALKDRDPSAAEACCRRAVDLRPDQADAHFILGNALHRLGRFGEAIVSYRRAIALDPHSVDAYHNLAQAFKEQGNLVDALAWCERAKARNGESAQIHSTFGNILAAQGKFDAAIISYRRAITLDPGLVEAHTNLGNALGSTGQLEESIASYKRALKLAPDFVEAHTNLLFGLNSHPAVSRDQVFAVCREWNDQHAAKHAIRSACFDNIRDPQRRLRIGYVSPDFRNHSVARFVCAFLDRHDRSQFTVYCYYNHHRRDALTEQIEAAADHWVACHAMSDEQLAQRIREDGIDILVDLAGHTEGNRLLVFARKPAPVQVTYLGYPATTGLRAMDYRLTHLDADPLGCEAYHSETLYRLPNSLYCYRPLQVPAPNFSPSPVLTKGFITFGSMNNFAKVSSNTIAVWIELLRTVSGSRLVMTSVPEGAARQSLYQRFIAHGVEANRITLHGRLPAHEFWKLLSQIDVALDPFPYNGTTTTCETLYWGVPVVTLIGQAFVSRQGYTLLKALGLEGLAAKTESEYVNIAAELARDPERVDLLHRQLRDRFETSPLRDEVLFTRDLEAAYREMWRKWCASYTADTLSAGRILRTG